MHHLSIGELKKMIEGLPDDAKVYYHRIEDSYFDNGKWQTKNKPNHEFSEPDQYVPAFGTVKYKDDQNLYITAHY